MKFKTIVITALLAGMPLATQAALVTKTFIATINDGALKGNYGTGNFTYDNALLITGNETLDALDGIKVNFSFDGQVFNETNDSGFGSINTFPELSFANFQANDLNYQLDNGVNGVLFTNPAIQGVYTKGLTASPGGYDFTSTLTAVPIPASIWLLFSGLTSLLVAGNKAKKSSTF